MANSNAPFHPIIYVRGYAMTPGEIDETSSDPFCGFNLGSTVYRAVPDRNRPARKFIFESPVIRLMSDFKYADVYMDGNDIFDAEWSENHKLKSRSIVIYRYYDEASNLLGAGKGLSMESFSKGLGKLIVRVRDLVCSNPENKVTEEEFRCYLVAHSMGGLVCRGLLQNKNYDEHNARQYVDKFFTYATPHNGIDVAGANVPSWLNIADIDNFNRTEIAAHLGLNNRGESDRVDWIPDSVFSSERIFCLVGTNRLDYEAAFGASRTFVGHGSDGLVRIENATLMGINDNGTPGLPCAKAFSYRSHSGFFGIVNSEEGYQNLTRFLFGDVRVDIWAEVNDITLPTNVQKALDDNKSVNALYQFEILASPLGKPWYLTRRTAEEDSVACLTHKEWAANPDKDCQLYLSTVFLANRSKVNTDKNSLTYKLSFNVRLPDYEIDNKFWVDEHFEGGYLFQKSIKLEIVQPENEKDSWNVFYTWDGGVQILANMHYIGEGINGEKFEILIPFENTATPGITGKLRFIVSAWNKDAVLAQ
jgi:hypothetical protein